MRVLFLTWSWHTHFFPMVPLAWACRAAGHEVRVLTQPALVGTVTRTGLPAVSVGQDIDAVGMISRYFSRPAARTPRPMEWEGLRQFGPRNVSLYVAACHAMLADAVDFGRKWQPDVVVFEATTYAG